MSLTEQVTHDDHRFLTLNCDHAELFSDHDELFALSEIFYFLKSQE